MSDVIEKKKLPRISFADFQAQLAAQSLDFDAMEFEKTPLLLDGEPVTYAGHHFDSIVWLKHKNTVRAFKQATVRGRLTHPNANRMNTKEKA